MQAAAARRVGAFTAGAERPALAAEVPHAGVDSLLMLRVEGEHRAAGRGVRALQRLRPRLAAVAGLVNTALVGVAPELAGDADPDRVRVRRIDGDLGDALGVLEAHVRPVVAAVHGLVDALADGDAVARPRLAGAGPDRLRVLRIDGDGADRLRGLLVEHRLERR